MIGGIINSVVGAINAAKQRKLEREGMNLQQNQSFEQSQLDRSRLQLDQQGAEQGAQSDAYRKAILGALGANMQDVGYSAEGGFAGGLRPSAIGAEGKAAVKMLGEQAMGALGRGPAPRPELEPYRRIQIVNQKNYKAPLVPGLQPGVTPKNPNT